MQREAKNFQFDFLRPQHSLFQYFTKLVDQYKKVETRSFLHLPAFLVNMFLLVIFIHIKAVLGKNDRAGQLQLVFG